MKTEEESDFVTFAKIVDKVYNYYSKLVEEEDLDEAYFPIRITVWSTTDNFEPLHVLSERDTRELPIKTRDDEE